jgi:streptogramin lyase
MLATGASAASPSPVARVAVGRAPCGAVAAFGALWVAVDGAGTLVRVDPTRNRVLRTIRIGPTVCSLVAGRGALWITRYRPGQLVRVDPRTGSVRRLAVGGEPFDVALAGDLWITSFSDGTLVRVDPLTIHVVRRVDLGGNPAGLALCAGRLWVGGGRDDSWLTAVDPATGDARRIDVGVEAPSWPTCVHGALWVTTPDSVLHVDPATGAVVARVVIGGTPARVLAAPDGTVWVTDKEQNRIVRVDPARNAVLDELPAGRGAFDVVSIGGTVWVTSYAGDDVWRFAVPASP